MKIVIVHNKYGKYSGEEAVVDAQIKLLESNGHQVITYFRSSEELETMSNAKLKAFFSALKNSKAIHDIEQILEKHQPDLVHIHNLYPLISPAILPVIKKYNIPIVMTVHNYRLLCPNGLFFTKGNICEKCTGVGKELNCITNNCEASLFKSTGYALRNFWARNRKYYSSNIDSYFCLTEFQKNKLVTNGFDAEKCTVIPNFYDREILDLDYSFKKRNYVAFAGRLSAEKGLPILLAAAKKLPHINFQLAGEMRDGYEKELDIPKNVILRGMLNRTEMKEFYTNARIYLHTSICYEGFPMVFPEAMAHKLPIIAPNMAGYPEVATENENALLFEPKNSIALAQLLARIWDDETLLMRLSLNGFAKVTKKYNASHYYALLNKAYTAVV